MVLALSLPTTFEHRDLLVDLTFGVVLVSILVQGLSMASVLRWAGAIDGGERHVDYMRLRGQLRATRQALHSLDDALAQGEIHQATHDRLRASLSGREASLEQELENLAQVEGAGREAELQHTAERLLEVERKAVQEAEKSGVIDEGVARALLEEITERQLRLESTGIVGAPPLSDGQPSEPRRDEEE